MKIRKRVWVLAAVVCLEILLLGPLAQQGQNRLHSESHLRPQDLLVEVGELACRIDVPEFPESFTLYDKQGDESGVRFRGDLEADYVGEFKRGWAEYLRAAIDEFRTGCPPSRLPAQTYVYLDDAAKQGFLECQEYVAELKRRHRAREVYLAVCQALPPDRPEPLPPPPPDLDYPGPFVDRDAIRSLWKDMTTEQVRQALAPAVPTQEPGPVLVYRARADSSYRLEFFDRPDSAAASRLKPGQALLRRVSWAGTKERPCDSWVIVHDEEYVRGQSQWRQTLFGR